MALATFANHSTAQGHSHIVQNQNRLPVLYFKLTVMRPSPNFRQRYDSSDRTWLPPRPHRSNLPYQHAVWYRYEGGRTVQMQTAPDSQSRQLYQTYSFYCSAQKIFIYPADALRHQVGDGSDNPRISRSASPDQDEDPGHDSSDDTDVDDDRENEDWAELAFSNDVRDGAYISHAAYRGYHGTRLGVKWLDQGQIAELLPSRNHADGTRIVQQGQGGMTGEIAVLIALVVYSVRPDSVSAALQHCLQTRYQPHGQTPGQGCKLNRRAHTRKWLMSI